MVKTAAQAAENYRRGVDAFGGAQTYATCGERKGSGFLAVASCLAAAKKSHLTTDMMVSKYQAAAGAS